MCKCTITVLNRTGQVVLTKPVNHESPININMTVSPGAYFIRAIRGNSDRDNKLMKPLQGKLYMAGLKYNFINSDR